VPPSASTSLQGNSLGAPTIRILGSLSFYATPVARPIEFLVRYQPTTLAGFSRRWRRNCIQ